MPVREQPSIYQLKVTLEDIKPPIWLDPEEFNLEETNSILAKYVKSKSN